MKTAITILSAMALLALGACAKQDDVGANTATEESTTNFDELGNDSSFGSDNVILPADNATAPNAADTGTADLNNVAPSNTN